MGILPQYKKQSRVKVIIDSFTDSEWLMISGSTDIKAECALDNRRIKKYDMNVDFSILDKTITIWVDIGIAWAVGKYVMDIRVYDGEEYFFIPSSGYIEFQVIEAITD